MLIAVILAAGRGTRLSQITKDIPKCLVNIGNKTLIERQIEILLQNSIKHIYVVVGYKADKVIRKVSKYSDLITYVMNNEYATTENIYSLYLTRNFVAGKEFILLNGDTVFEECIIEELAKKVGINVAPIDTNYYDLEELKIRKEGKFVAEILPKDAPREISDGSTIGIFKFSSEGSKIFFKEIEKCIEEGNRKQWFEFALNRILPRLKMEILDIHGFRWIEIDTMEDLERARRIFR